MRDVLLVRFGEVHLKGLNRPYFLRKLVDNIKRAVEPMGGRVWMSDSRIYVRDCPDMDGLRPAGKPGVRRTFGKPRGVKWKRICRPSASNAWP